LKVKVRRCDLGVKAPKVVDIDK